MVDINYAIYTYSCLMIFAMIFQFILALGVPWGDFAMGGKFSGKLPPIMRIISILQILVLLFAVIAVLATVGFIFQEYQYIAKRAIWFVVVFHFVSLALNIITPSKKERMLWSPICVLLFACSVIIALNK